MLTTGCLLLVLLATCVYGRLLEDFGLLYGRLLEDCRFLYGRLLVDNSPDSQRSVDNPSAALRGVGAAGGGESARLAFGRSWSYSARRCGPVVGAIAGLEG